ncbi:hypothetical protein R5R35_006350 [Gryllus longicercus]|uniref:Uncharacterized protein n=1 Tax=Gryllus longicercus TaxID=2509291 RepID=A0AAN9ZEV2_9ORTH
MLSGLTPSEERRRNGQYAAVCLVLVAAVMGLYHACTRQNAVLAGFMVPALIMLLYLLWVLYSASRARAKQRLLQATAAVSPAPTPAPVSAPALATTPAHATHHHHAHGKHHGTHHTHHHAQAHKIPKVVVQGPTPVRELEPEKIV